MQRSISPSNRHTSLHGTCSKSHRIRNSSICTNALYSHGQYLDEDFIPGCTTSPPSSPWALEDSSEEWRPLDADLLDDEHASFLNGDMSSLRFSNEISARRTIQGRSSRNSRLTSDSPFDLCLESERLPSEGSSTDVHQTEYLQGASVWHRSPVLRPDKTSTILLRSVDTSNLMQTPTRNVSRQKQSERNAFLERDNRKIKSRRTYHSSSVHDGSPHVLSQNDHPQQPLGILSNRRSPTSIDTSFESQLINTQLQQSPYYLPQHQSSILHSPPPNVFPDHCVDGFITSPNRVSLGRPIFLPPSVISPAMDGQQLPTATQFSTSIDLNTSDAIPMNISEVTQGPSTPAKHHTLLQRQNNNKSCISDDIGPTPPLVTQSAPRSFRMAIPQLYSPVTTLSYTPSRNRSPTSRSGALLRRQSLLDNPKSRSDVDIRELPKLRQPEDEQSSEFSGRYGYSTTSRSNRMSSYDTRSRINFRSYLKQRNRNSQRECFDNSITTKSHPSLHSSNRFLDDCFIDDEVLCHRVFQSPRRLIRRFSDHYAMCSPQQVGTTAYLQHQEQNLLSQQRSITLDPLPQKYQSISLQSSPVEYYVIPHIQGDPSPLSHRRIPTVIQQEEPQKPEPNLDSHRQLHGKGIPSEVGEQTQRRLTSELPIQHVRISPRLNPFAYHPGLPKDISTRTPLYPPSIRLTENTDYLGATIEEVYPSSQDVASNVDRDDRTPSTKRMNLKGIRNEDEKQQSNRREANWSSPTRRDICESIPRTPDVHLASRRLTYTGGMNRPHEREDFSRSRRNAYSSSALHLSASSGHRETSDYPISFGVTSEGTIDFDEDEDEHLGTIQRSPFNTPEGQSPSVTPRIVPKTGSSVGDNTRNTCSVTSAVPTINYSSVESIDVGHDHVVDGFPQEVFVEKGPGLENNATGQIAEGSILGHERLIGAREVTDPRSNRHHIDVSAGVEEEHGENEVDVDGNLECGDGDETLVVVEDFRKDTDGLTQQLVLLEDENQRKNRRYSVASFACQVHTIEDDVIVVVDLERDEQIVVKKPKEKKKTVTNRLKELGQQGQRRGASNWNLGGTVPQPPLIFTPIEKIPYRESQSMETERNGTGQLTSGSSSSHQRPSRYPKRHRFPPIRHWIGEHIEYERDSESDCLIAVGVHRREGMPDIKVTADDALRALREERKRRPEKKGTTGKKVKEIGQEHLSLTDVPSIVQSSSGNSFVPKEKVTKKRKRAIGDLFSEFNGSQDDEIPNNRNAIVPLTGRDKPGGRVISRDELRFVEVDTPSGPFEVAMVSSKKNLYDLCEMHFYPSRNKGPERSTDPILGDVLECDDRCCLILLGEEMAKRNDIQEIAKKAKIVDKLPVHIVEGAMRMSWNGTFHIPRGVWYNFVNLSKTKKLIMTVTVLRGAGTKGNNANEDSCS